MKKTISLILSFMICITYTTFSYSDSDISIQGETAVLIDSATREILYDKGMHKQMYPASTTKIMTAILTLENCDLDEVVTIDSQSPFTGGSRIYLVEGEKLTIEQLLYALLLESANDAAVALAIHISGSVDEFAKLMNQKAKELGALNTHFTNPNGLPDEAHLTTAYDLAMIAKYAMKNDTFRKIVGTSRYDIPATEKQDERHIYTRNRLLWDETEDLLYNGEYVAPKYEYATGVKTGYTIAAGNCLVASAKKDGREVISVVLRSDPNNIFLDSRKLLDHGLQDFKNIILATQGNIQGSVKIDKGIQDFIDVAVKENIYKTVAIDFDETKIKKQVDIPDEMTAPISEGAIIGNMQILDNNNRPLGEVELLAAGSVGKSTLAIVLLSIGHVFKSIKLMIAGIVLIVVGYFLLAAYSNINRKKRRKQRRKKYKLDNDYVYRNLLK